MSGKEYETVTDSIRQHQPNAGVIMSSAGQYQTSTPYVQARGLVSLPARLNHYSSHDSNSRSPGSNNQTYPGVHINYADNGPRNSHQRAATPLKQHNVDIQSDCLLRQGSTAKPSKGPIKQGSLDASQHYHNVTREDSISRQSGGPIKQSSLDIPPQHHNVPCQDSAAGPSSSCPSSISSAEIELLPNKKNTSVYSVVNERYVLDKVSIRDHENEDEFLVHSNDFSVCLCVMDGHDGQNAVKYVREYLWKKVFSTRSWLKVSQVDNPDHIKTALVEFIKVIDADFFRSISTFINEKVHLQSQIPKVIICMVCIEIRTTLH